jgi:aryl-alcohol dehydrogenase-like predicted oxidoreductase
MNYRILGRTGLNCSEIGLGTWAFASQVYGAVSDREAINAIGAAQDAGINFFDTAPLYGNEERNGISEEILGRGLGVNRKDVYLSTKFGRYATEGAAPHFHAQRARESVEGSLRRLGTDHVDILFFHSPFGEEDIHDDVWDELDRLKLEGKVRFIGHSISKFADTQEMAQNWVAERRIDVVQVVYSLMNREAGAFIEQMGAAEVGVIAREALANGFLSGGVRRDTVFGGNHLNSRYDREEIEERVSYIEQIEFLVRPPVATLPQAAFRWVLDNPHVSLVLSGASNADHVRDGAAASELPGYSADEIDRARTLHVRDFEAA